MRAASPTRRVIGPACEVAPKLLSGQTGTRPNVGFRPKTPLKAAGMRIDPPPSVPMWKTPMPSAAAAAAPPLEPPAVRDGAHGLPVAPNNGLSVVPFQPNSGELVL